MDKGWEMKVAGGAAVAAIFVLAALAVVWTVREFGRKDAELRALSERLAASEKRLGELESRQVKVAARTESLEKWVETSSVEGRLKAYSRQAEEEYRALTEKVREKIKETAVKTLNAANEALGN